MANEAQKEYWNGEVGARWAERDDFMTRLLEPAAFALLEKISPASGIDAIDIGCGGGSQTITLAEKIGVGGSVLGVDISAPLLDCARERLIRQGLVRANVEFLKADADADADEQYLGLLSFRRGATTQKTTLELANAYRML